MPLLLNHFIVMLCFLFVTAKIKSGKVITKGRGPKKENGRVKFEDNMDVEIDIGNVKRKFKLTKKNNVEKDKFEVRHT